MCTPSSYICLRETDAFAVPDGSLPAVAVFEAGKKVAAEERFSVDGRRWLFVRQDGTGGVYTPWADIEGEPLWKLATNPTRGPAKSNNNNNNKNTKTPTAKTPLVTSINKGNQQPPCSFRNCPHVAQTRCESCERLVCVAHRHTVRQAYQRLYTYCPDCASRKRRYMTILAIFLLCCGIVALAVLLYMYLTHQM